FDKLALKHRSLPELFTRLFLFAAMEMMFRLYNILLRLLHQHNLSFLYSVWAISTRARSKPTTAAIPGRLDFPFRSCSSFCVRRAPIGPASCPETSNRNTPGASKFGSPWTSYPSPKGATYQSAPVASSARP